MNFKKSNWNIDGIQFSILSEKEIINRAVTEINKIKLKNNDKIEIVHFIGGG